MELIQNAIYLLKINGSITAGQYDGKYGIDIYCFSIIGSDQTFFYPEDIEAVLKLIYKECTE